jgi:hypothetical protein
MGAVDWYVEGVQFGGCNCAFGCPCQFEALPTHGHCRGFEVLRIDKGHFGDVGLDGLQVAIVYAWPGPIFEGHGEMQAIVDERANAHQREALVKIVHGEETEEGATHWWVYRTMSETIHEPLFLPIQFEADIESRSARLAIPGVLESVGQPIRSPATGDEHRVRIEIPNGIEFESAEMGSTVTKARGAIQLDLDNTYGQFNALRHSGRGVVHT